MAESNILAPFILSHEGGFANDKDDPGGATNRGITIGTFRLVFGKDKTVSDLKKISYDQWSLVYKKFFWDKCKADLIDNQSVANMLVDFAWHSGVSKAVKHIQEIVGVETDGIMGRVTIGAINGYYKGQKYVFKTLKANRLTYLRGRKNWWKYKNGWCARLGNIKYGSLTYNNIEVKC